MCVVINCNNTDKNCLLDSIVTVHAGVSNVIYMSHHNNAIMYVKKSMDY